MYLEQAIVKENPFWKYLVGSLLIIFASLVGYFPIVTVINYKKTDPAFSNLNEEEILKSLDSNFALFLMLFSFVFGLLGVFYVSKIIHKQSIKLLTTSREKIDWNRIFFAFGLWSIITIVVTIVGYFVYPDDFVVNFKPIPFIILFVIGVIFIPLQTSCEEYIFRGYLMQGFGRLFLNKWAPLFFTSVLFGGMHYFNPEVAKMGNIVMIYYIGTGFFLGIITLMDEGMELALGFHAANNLVGALLITSDWSAFQTHSILKDISEPKAGLDVILPVLIIYPILIWVFSKKYNWTNWKEKLSGNININTINTYNNHD